MAPRASKNTSQKSQKSLSQKSSQKTSQPCMEDILEQLCTEIPVAARNNGEIKLSKDVLNSLNEALRNVRNKKLLIKASAVAAILPVLETEGNEYCRKLDDTTVSVILETVLNAEYCHEGERIMYLFAATLFDSRGNSNSRAAEKKMAAIGKKCLNPSVEYFVDVGKHPGIRRWVGILLLQLLDGSEDTRNTFELGAEDLRRKVGPLTLNEPNEIIRVICGNVIRALLHAGTVAAHMWPQNTPEEIYSTFPVASQAEKGWAQLFNDWVDSCWRPDEGGSNPKLTEQQLYFSQSVITEPHYEFGTYGHHVDMVVDQTHISLFAAANNGRFDQSLDIPISSITQIIVQESENLSQVEFSDLVLELQNTKDLYCYIDSKGVLLKQVTLTIVRRDLDMFIEDLRRMNPDREISIINLEVVNDVKHASSGDFPFLTSEVGTEGHSQRDVQLCADPEVTEDTKNQTPQRSDSSGTTQKMGSGEDLEQEDLYDASPLPPKAPKNPGRSAVLKESSSTKLQNVNESVNYIKLQAQNLNNSQPKDDIETLPKNGRVEKGGSGGVIERSAHNSEGNHQMAHILSDTSANELATLTRKGKAVLEAVGLHANTSSRILGLSSDTLTSTNEHDTPTPKPATGTRQIQDIVSFPPAQTPVTYSTRKHPGQGEKRYKQYPLKPKVPLFSTQPAESSSALGKSNGKMSNEQGDGKSPGKELSKLSKKKVDECSQANAEDEWVVPQDPEDEKASKPIAKAGKKGPKKSSRASEPTIKKIKNKVANAIKSLSQKRQSVPAAMDRPSSVIRRSQRAVVNEASNHLHELEAEDDEEEIPEVPTPQRTAKPKALQTGKKLQATAPTTKTEEKSIDSPKELPLKQNEDIYMLQQRDAQELCLVDPAFLSPNVPLGRDLYDATPEKPKAKALKSGLPKKTLLVNMSSKLNSLLSVLDDPPPHNKLDNAEAKEINKSPTTAKKQSNSVKIMEQTRPHEDEHKIKVADAEQSKTGDKLVIADDENHQPKSVPQLNGHSPIMHAPKRNVLKRSRVVEQPLSEEEDKIHMESHDSAKRRKPDTEAQELANPTPASKKKNKANQVSQPKTIRRSPRLAAKATNASPAAISEKPLLNDSLVRKPQVISFGAKGALNQGPLSTLKESAKPDYSTEEVTKPTANINHKRKRLLAEADPNNQSPTKKRQSVSPAENHPPVEIEQDGMQNFQSSPPVPQFSKQSSQVSRVDENGSPIASRKVSQRDHIGKIERKLQNGRGIEGLATKIPVSSPKPTRQGRPTALRAQPSRTEVFGSKFALSSIAKPKPAPPGDIGPRYIAHKRINDGTYEGVCTKEVIAPGKALADPFTENIGPKASDFTMRLRAGKSKAAAETNSYQKVTFEPPGDTDKTLVEPTAQQSYSRLVCSGEMSMTDDSSESNPREVSRSPLPEANPNQTWNMAIRSHYRGYAEAVHKVADDMVMRLQSEEDQLANIVHQYEDNGAKIMNNFLQKRAAETTAVEEALEKKRQETVRIYTEARDFVMQTTEELKASSIAGFEKLWREDQAIIQKLISEGQRELQG